MLIPDTENTFVDNWDSLTAMHIYSLQEIAMVSVLVEPYRAKYQNRRDDLSCM